MWGLFGGRDGDEATPEERARLRAGTLAGFGSGAASIGMMDTPAMALAKLFGGGAQGRFQGQQEADRYAFQKDQIDLYKRRVALVQAQAEKAVGADAQTNSAIEALARSREAAGDADGANALRAIGAIDPKGLSSYLKGDVREANGALYKVGPAGAQKLVEAGLSPYQEAQLANDGARIGLEGRRVGIDQARAAREAAAAAREREGQARLQALIDRTRETDPAQADRLQALLVNPAVGAALGPKLEAVPGQGLVSIGPGSTPRANVVVPEGVPASTRAELDARAEEAARRQGNEDRDFGLREKDFGLRAAAAGRNDARAGERFLWEQNAKAVDQEIARQRAEAEAAAARAKGGGKGFTQANQLRGQWNAQTKALRDVPTAYRRMDEAFGQDSGAGDIAGIYGFMKMLDPTSVVREGEFATAENAGGVAPWIRNLFNRARSGERLTPEVRRQLLDAAGSQLKGYREEYDQLAGHYKGLATRAGLDPADVIAPIEWPETGAPGRDAPGIPAPARDAPGKRGDEGGQPPDPYAASFGFP